MTVRVIATAGHVDHGKSTLVRALTGSDPDRFAEEKQRGLTIDLGFARMPTASGIDLDIIDVPGHVRFLKNMLAGVGAVDACLFVVSAAEGWMPQTEEHLRVLELLGTSRGVVALTMAGAVDADDLELARMEIAEHAAGTFLEHAEVVAVDVVADGLGLGELRAALDRLARALPGALDRGRPRLWVDRSFAIAGAGTVVTGTLTGGRIAVGDHMAIATPTARLEGRVRGLQAFGHEQAELPPGCRAAINLVGITHHVVRRGDALVRPGQWHLTSTLDASLRLLDSAVAPVRGRGAYVAHIGSGEHPVRLRVLGAPCIEPGHEGFLRLSLPAELPLLPGDRYVLRDSGSATTVGGGEVLDVDPVLRPSRAAPDRSVERVVRERGWIDASELERLTGERLAPVIGPWVVDPEALTDLRSDVRRRVHAAGVSGFDVALLDDRERMVVEDDVELTVAAGRIVGAGSTDPYAQHPYLETLSAQLFSPPSPADESVGRQDVRELVRRGLVIELDGIVFAAGAVDAAAGVAADLLAEDAAGFTVATFREALATTRKYALPLALELDDRGITRRRGDVRIAGPRLPRRVGP